MTKPNLIFAGTRDGGVQAWNLLDSEKLGETLNIMNSSMIIQRPSYSTDGLYSISRIHEGGIVCISSIDATSHSTSESSSSSIGLSSLMQICTIDEFGFIQFWSVAEVAETATRENIDFDLGMAIGSSIRIIKGTGFSCKKMQSSR